MKKTTSVFLIFILVLNIFSVSVFAEDNGSWSYNVLSEEDKTAEITDYNGTSTVLEFPSEIDGYTMVAIAAGFFNNLNNKYLDEDIEKWQYVNSITKVTIPDTYKRIEQNVLVGLASLEEVNLPDTLEFIGMNSLQRIKYMYDLRSEYAHNSLPTVYYYGQYCISADQGGDMPKTYVINPGTTLIASSAFLNAPDVEKIIIPKSVKYINTGAFIFCSSLRMVVIPSGVERLEQWTFLGNNVLTAIEIPESVTYIDEESITYNGYSVTIYGVAGSEAERFALAHGFAFSEIEKTVYGDVDGDDEITINDYALLKNFLVDDESLDGNQEYLGDTNHDQVVDGFDIYNVNKALNGLD